MSNIVFQGTSPDIIFTVGYGTLGTGGHIIQDKDEVDYPDRSILQLAGDATVADDEANDRTVVTVTAGTGGGPTHLGNDPTISNVKVTSSTGNDTTIVAATSALAGVMSGAQVSSLDGHVANNGIHVTPNQSDALNAANSPSAGNAFLTANDGGGHTIQDDGADMAQQPNVNYVGSQFEITNDIPNSATKITLHRLPIQNSGSPVPEEEAVNFLEGLQALDDVGGSRTNIKPVYGTGADTVTEGDDSRLSNDRNPTAHSTTHRDGGADPLSHLFLPDIGTRPHSQLETEIDGKVDLNGNQTVFDVKTFRSLQFGASGTENLLPSDRGVSGQILTTNAAGAVSWGNAASIITSAYLSDATSDGQGSVALAWNEYANRIPVSRSSNEIIYWTWPSTDGAVYQYLGSQLMPTWTSQDADFLEVGSSISFAEFPVDFDGNSVGEAVDPNGGNQAYLQKSTNAPSQTVVPTITFDKPVPCNSDPSADEHLTRRSWVTTQLSTKKDDFSENTGFNKDFGAIAGTVTEGNDSRLSDSRTPSAHAASHSSGSSDPINHASLSNVGTNSHAVLDSHVADANIHYAKSSISHTEIQDIGTKSHATIDSELDAKLDNVVEDTTPELGGNLDTKGFDILIGDGTGGYEGIIANVDGSTGTGFGYSSDGLYDPTNGAVLVSPGKVTLRGSVAIVDALTGADNRDVQVAPDGTLYASPLPIPGWSDSDSDNGDYPLPLLGIWVELTGLVTTIQVDVADGDRLDLVANIHLVNNSVTRAGSVSVSWGLGVGVEPTGGGVNTLIPGDFDNLVPINISTTTHGGLTAGQAISVWARRQTEDHGAFDPECHGSTGSTHEFTLSVPGEGGGGGGGDPTNLGNTPSTSSVTITSSTGTNTVVAAATGAGGTNIAGVMTPAQVDVLSAAGDLSGPGAAVVDESIVVFDGTSGTATKSEGAGFTANNISWFQLPGQYGAQLTEKATPVSADRILIEDSAASFGKQYIEIGSLPGGTPDLTDAEFPTYAVFDAVFGAAADIDFANGNKQTLDVTGLSLTLTAPGPGSFIVDMVNSDSLVAITTTVLWDSGTVPTWAGRSILALFWDGTTWYGSAMVGVA